jgi:dihydrofolate reductase
MGKLIYSAITSLDLFIADADGKFDWAMPDAEVHQHANDASRDVGTYLYGRRMYDVMVAWETIRDTPDAIANEFGELWRGTDKIVYSRSLSAVKSARTRIEPRFDAEAVSQLKATAERDIAIGGAHLAAEALDIGLVDEIQLYLNPIIVGSGIAALPDSLWQKLELVEERRFGNGVVFVRYACVAEPGA